MVDEHYTPEHGKPWDDDQLLPAEKILLAKAKVGERAFIRPYLEDPNEGDWTAFAKDHEIRGKLIRHILIYPDAYLLDPCGIDIEGAHITGALYLQHLTIDHRIGFTKCLFDMPPVLLRARTLTLNFEACSAHGFIADGLLVQGDLLMQRCVFDFECRLVGADVKGTVSFEKSSFKCDTEGHHKLALSADRLKIEGNLVLSGTTIIGEMRLLGAVVHGDVDGTEATFNNVGGYALNAQRLTVAGRLFLTKLNAPPLGAVDFTNAHAGYLIDDESAWPDTGLLRLDGFTYDKLSQAISITERMRWLSLMPTHDAEGLPIFFRQPYEQLKKVLRQEADYEGLTKVSIEYEDVFRAYWSMTIKSWLFRQAYIAGSAVYRSIAGYGHKLFRVIPSMIIVVAFFWLWSFGAYHSGYIVPAKESVYMDICYPNGIQASGTCHAGWEDHVRGFSWLLSAPPIALPKNYPAFHSAIFTIDTFVPFADLHQESFWTVSDDGQWGETHRNIFLIFIILGGVLSTVFAAGLLSLIKKD